MVTGKNFLDTHDFLKISWTPMNVEQNRGPQTGKCCNLGSKPLIELLNPPTECFPWSR